MLSASAAARYGRRLGSSTPAAHGVEGGAIARRGGQGSRCPPCGCVSVARCSEQSGAGAEQLCAVVDVTLDALLQTSTRTLEARRKGAYTSVTTAQKGKGRAGRTLEGRASGQCTSATPVCPDVSRLRIRRGCARRGGCPAVGAAVTLGLIYMLHHMLSADEPLLWAQAAFAGCLTCGRPRLAQGSCVGVGRPHGFGVVRGCGWSACPPFSGSRLYAVPVLKSGYIDYVFVPVGALESAPLEWGPLERGAGMSEGQYSVPWEQLAAGWVNRRELPAFPPVHPVSSSRCSGRRPAASSAQRGRPVWCGAPPGVRSAAQDTPYGS